MDAPRAAAATWTLWGFALALLGIANLAVMGYDPVPNQHAFVGTGMVVVPLLAALATQALWPRAPGWTWLVAAVAGTGRVLLGSVLGHTLGAVGLYGLGDAGAASREAAIALLATLWSAALAVALRRVVPWWPGASACVLCAALYVWASSWGFGGMSDGAEMWGGAVLNGLVVVLFAATGWVTAFTASRTPGPEGPARA